MLLADLPLAEDSDAVALTIVDVPEGVGPHPCAGRRPPVIQAIGLVFGTHAQEVIGRQVDIGAKAETGVLAVGIQRVGLPELVLALVGVPAVSVQVAAAS